MTWAELRLLLNSMNDMSHTALTGSPAERVMVLMDNELWYLDIVESVSKTSEGKLVFVPSVLDGGVD